MKTLFLTWFRKGEPQDAPFVFVAYNYGAFCKDVYDTLADMLRDGLVEQYDNGNPQTAPYFVTALGSRSDVSGRLIFEDSQQLQSVAR
jgi:hypothetical protein